MFIREQMIRTLGDLSPEFLAQDPAGQIHHNGLREFLELWVWSPIACRHTSWTYKPVPYGKALWGF